MSWRPPGGGLETVWMRLEAFGRGRDAFRGRLLKQTRPFGSKRSRDSAAPERDRAQTSANEYTRARPRTDQRVKVYLSG